MSNILTREAFVRLVAEAYTHLYDPVFLRAHPLAHLLIGDRELQPRERAWRLQRLLIEAIEDLDSGRHAPSVSLEARRYQLMSLHHVEGLDPQTVADRLSISRRHYYREHESAIAAVAALLWERYTPQRQAAEERVLPAPGPADRLEMLRLEAARLAQAGRYAGLRDVVAGVLSLLDERLQQQNMTVSLSLPDDLPIVASDRNLLRQMLLTMLSYLIERAQPAMLTLAARSDSTRVSVEMMIAPPEAVRQTSDNDVQERKQAIEDLAALGKVSVDALRRGAAIVGFALQLPVVRRRTILVVDDNEDVLELFTRYLTAHGFEVVTANTGRRALSLAQEIKPYAITLDLMMPEQDGWDVLQTLINQLETQSIPVIVCSVLMARELALSLGAAAFLAKPVTEQALLEAIQALEQA